MDSKEQEPDDYLHDVDPVRDARLDSHFDIFSMRGWANMSMLILVAGGLIILFAGYPVIRAVVGTRSPTFGGFNLGGINGSGQIPDLPGVRPLVDNDTPDNVKLRTGFDGHQYKLVFSDKSQRKMANSSLRCKKSFNMIYISGPGCFSHGTSSVSQLAISRSLLVYLGVGQFLVTGQLLGQW